MFTSIKLKDWRQFDNVDIAFDEHMTILTGANGSGKTTLLNVLGRHFGWIAEIASTPKINDEGSLLYDTDYHISEYELEQIDQKNRMIQNSYSIGELAYDVEKTCNIRVPQTAGTTYQLLLDGQQAQKGIFLSSHRNVFHYQNVSNIPANAIKREEAHSGYSRYLLGRYNEEWMGNDTGATRQIKRTLISWAVYGYGNKAVKADITAKEMFEGFQNVLSMLLPPSLGYEKLEIDSPEVILKTSTGDFAIDAVSGGIAALIEIAWQIFMCGKQDEKFTVVFDEPENHLHPELQRNLMPSLMKAFPNVQFVVATHNPFVIGSVEMSKVYVLNYNDNNRVESFCLEDVNKAGTANEILRDVLGIPVTFGGWVEERLDQIVEKYIRREITEDSIKELKEELKGIGMESYIPESIVKVMEAKR